MVIGLACLVVLFAFDNDKLPTLLEYLFFAIAWLSGVVGFVCGLIYRREQQRAPLL
jgi:hypothetical protein